MRALVADGDIAFAKAIAHALGASAEVDVLHDGAQAVTALRAHAYDVVIAEWLLPSADGVSLVRALRESESTAPFVMCTVLTQREAHEYALAAGATEVFGKPARAEVLAAAALAHMVPSPGAPRAPLLGAMRIAGGEDDVTKFCAKPSWRGITKTLVKALSAATGTLLREVRAEEVPPTDRYDSRTTLGMVDVRARVRVELGLFTTLDSGRALVRYALRQREPDSEDVTEFLSEMCNQALGALKSAMKADRMQFTLFIARTRFVPVGTSFDDQFPVSRTVHIVGQDGIRMMAVLGAKPCAVNVVSVAALRDNMVLVEDLADADGAVLAEAATRLTASALVRIKARASGRSVRVAE
jgi:DNA-binding response OmpR family regulator